MKGKGTGKRKGDTISLEQTECNKLTGENARTRKALRSVNRLGKPAGQRAGAYGPQSSAPPPRVCNRVAACEWNSKGSPCECAKWPQWLAEHGIPSKRAITLAAGDTWCGNEAIYVNANEFGTQKGMPISYYRPAGTKGSYFYSGKLLGVWNILFPTGKRINVVGLN